MNAYSQLADTMSMVGHVLGTTILVVGALLVARWVYQLKIRS